MASPLAASSVEDALDVVVLAVTLVAAAGIVLVTMAPVVFEEVPPGVRRARPWVAGAAALAVVLILLEAEVFH